MSDMASTPSTTEVQNSFVGFCNFVSSPTAHPGDIGPISPLFGCSSPPTAFLLQDALDDYRYNDNIDPGRISSIRPISPGENSKALSNHQRLLLRPELYGNLLSPLSGTPSALDISSNPCYAKNAFKNDG